MRQSTLLLLPVFGFFLALVSSTTSLRASDTTALLAANTAIASHDHPASDGSLSAPPHTLPGMDAPPDAAQATVVDPRNPAWVTHYGTTAGVKYFPARQSPAPLIPQAPPIDVGAWRNLFPGGAATVNGMAAAPDGRVFVAVAGGGLDVYGPQNNGAYAWSTITASGQGLQSNNVNAVLVDGNRLYVGTSDAGLSVMDLGSGNWTWYNTGNSGIASNNVGRMAVSFVLFSGDQIWMATDNGVSKLSQSSFTNYLSGNNVYDVAIRYTGIPPNFIAHVWVAERDVVLDLNPANSSTISYNFGNTGTCAMHGAQRVVVDTHNVLWFIKLDFTPNKPDKPNAPADYFIDGVCSFDGGSTWKLYNDINPGLPNNSPTDLSVDYAGRVWMSFGGAGGGAVYDQDTWWTTVPSDGLLYSYNVNAVQAIGEDVWWGFTNSNGVSLYAPNWRPFVPSQMGGSGQPTALRSDANLTLIGLGTGISWWDGYNWYNNVLPGNSSAVTSFARSGSGVLWTGTAGSGVYNYNGSGYTQHTTADGLPSNNIRALLFDQSGKFWVATNAGLALRGNGYWDVFSQATSQISSDNLSALAEDKRGRIWIGTNANGIDIYDPKATGTNPWKTETTTNGLPSNNVNALAEDPSGDIWAATANGLGQWDHKNHTWTTWNTSNADLPGNNILAVSSDPAGRVWVGTTLGLAVYDAGTWNPYHVSGSMLRSDRVAAVVSDGNQVWAAGGNTVAVRGQITGPLGNYPPSISDFSPSQGAPLTTLTINGSGFDDRGPAYNQVNFTGIYQGIYNVPAQVLSASASQLTVHVPELAYSGPFQVTSHHLNGQSATPFTLAPALSGLSATCVGMGNELDIFGDGFISQSGGSPYAYVKIGSGPWRPADAVDPTEIRQIIRPGDTAGTVSVALGTASGPTVTSSQSIAIATPAVYSFGIQQGVQGEQMIWAKRTAVLVNFQSSGGACSSNIDGGYLEWLKTDHTTYWDGYVHLPATSGLTVFPNAPLLSLIGSAGFVMFDGLLLSEYPSQSEFAGLRIHVSNGPIELLTYDIPASNFNFVDTHNNHKLLMIHVVSNVTDTVQTEQTWWNNAYTGMSDAGRVFPEEDVDVDVGPASWMVIANPVIGRDGTVNLTNSDTFQSLRNDGDSIFSLLNDSGGGFAQGTTLLDQVLYNGGPSGKATTSCSDAFDDCNRHISSVFNFGSSSPQTGPTLLQETVHVSGWVDSHSPNYGISNPASGHSKYDEDRTTNGCDNNTNFHQALIDELGYAGRVIRLADGQDPYQFPDFGCDPAFEPRSAMSYAPNQYNGNAFLEPTDYAHFLYYVYPCPPFCFASANTPAAPAAGTNWRVAGDIDSGNRVTITLAYLLPAGGQLSKPSAPGGNWVNLRNALLSGKPLFSPSTAATHFQLNLRAANSSLLYSLPFVAGGTLSDGTTDPLPYFNLLTPFPAGTARAEIVNQGNVIWSQLVSAATPTVGVVAPNGGSYNEANPITISWNASETGNPPLKFMLDYSGDNGATWHPISGVVAGTSFSWKPGFIPPTNQARVRVRASDGFNVGSAASNPFALTAQPPQALVTSPATGDSFAEGQTIKLAGGSVTPDGLNAGAFQWSHGNNAIGASRNVTFTLNHIGQQVFNLQVVDAGLTATQRITVTVLPNFANNGIPDAWLLQYKLNPLDPNVAFEDPDGDGLTNLQEYQYGSNPIVADTDGDTFNDGAEVAAGTDPRDPNQKPAATPVLHVGTNNLGWTVQPVGPAPKPWTIAVSNGGAGTVNWSISAPPPWLHVAPLSATAPTTVTFTALPQGLPTGAYSTNLNVTAAGASGSPQVIHVTLNIIGFQIDLPVIRR